MLDTGGLKKQLNGKAVGIVGLGASGRSVVAALEKGNIPFYAWDDQKNENNISISQTEFFIPHENPYNIGLLILAPGIPLTHPQPHKSVAWAQSLDIPIIGDIELFWRYGRKKTDSQLVAITGTNGKSTTTALIGHILTECNKNVQTGGNLGYPVFDLDDDADYYVLELSSYQLDLLDQAWFDIAVLLNFSPDHLARHGDMEGYIKAKSRIFKNCHTAIIGQDDQWSVKLATQIQQPTPILFSHHNIDSDLAAILSNHVALRGLHNAQNAMAALNACLSLGLDKQSILKAIAKFSGLEHRQQKIHQQGNILFINDSKATNADATGKALSAYDNIYWLVGGRPKETGLEGLEIYADKIRHAFLIGEAVQTFPEWLTKNHIPYTICDTLDKAVSAAWQMASNDNLQKTTSQSEGVIMLSPACASWDQYPNFEARGQHFIDLVQNIFSNKDEIRKEAL